MGSRQRQQKTSSFRWRARSFLSSVTTQEDEEICLLPGSTYRQAEKYRNSKTLSEVREDPVGVKDELALKLNFLHQTTLPHAFRDHKELDLHVHGLQVSLLGPSMMLDSQTTAWLNAGNVMEMEPVLMTALVMTKEIPP